MARKCEICGKGTTFGRSIARRGLAKKKGGVGKKITGITRRTFKPNIQKINVEVDGGKRKIRICASCLKAGKVKKAVK